ncbi:MAG: flagellar hook protein FlgE [Ilumatobacteraceae bacterium]
MLRSLFASISGLRAHQTMMDVTANNIANVNTQGFKSGRAIFSDALAQTIRGGGIPTDGSGSTNPMQVGLGTRVAAVNTNFTQGSLQLTGRTTDLAIQGDGFFVVERGDVQLLTRDGAFNWDANGELVTSGGAKVMGWQVDPDTGELNVTDTPGVLSVPTGVLPPTPTSTMTLGGNIKAGIADGDTVVTTVTVYNTLGTAFDLKATMTKTGQGTFDVSFTTPDPDDPTTEIELDSTSIEFDEFGALVDPVDPASFDMTGIVLGDGTDQDITVNFGSPLHALTSFDQASTMDVPVRDGAAGAELFQVNFGTDGSITAQYTNGDSRIVGMVAIGTVTNPEGLQKMADNLYSTTLTSGDPTFGAAGTGEYGTVAPGSLEGSNVDLANEFTNLVLAQRGFQANTRVITTSDEMLADLVNVKR